MISAWANTGLINKGTPSNVLVTTSTHLVNVCQPISKSAIIGKPKYPTEISHPKKKTNSTGIDPRF